MGIGMGKALGIGPCGFSGAQIQRNVCHADKSKGSNSMGSFRFGEDFSSWKSQTTFHPRWGEHRAEMSNDARPETLSELVQFHSQQPGTNPWVGPRSVIQFPAKIGIEFIPGSIGSSSEIHPAKKASPTAKIGQAKFFQFIGLIPIPGGCYPIQDGIKILAKGNKMAQRVYTLQPRAFFL